jgi:Niemann-Pick C1 protein
VIPLPKKIDTHTHAHTHTRTHTHTHTGIAGLSSGLVAASALRTYHTPLGSQEEFIGALSAARTFTADASAALGLRIYPYSIFHVFFEQYLTVGHTAVTLLGAPLFAVCGVAWAFTGSAWGAAILAGMLASLLLQLGGAMYLAGIQVNAGMSVNMWVGVTL